MRAHDRGDGDDRPLVAVLYRVPLICEAICSALEPIVDTTQLPAQITDLLGLLDAVRPDAIVVDDDREAGEMSLYARAHGVPLLHVDPRAQRLRILDDEGVWRIEDGVTAESVRNAVAGTLLRRPAVRA